MTITSTSAHAHTQKSIPALDALSTDPILFTQVPALDTVLSKFTSFIDSAAKTITTADAIKLALASEIFPYLKARFPPGANSKKGPSASHPLLVKWAHATRILSESLPPAQLFPLVDLWRLALLDDAVGAWCASRTQPTSDPIHVLLGLALTPELPRNYVLTVLRMIANAFATPALARALLADGPNGKRKELTQLLVSSVLHPDGQVRTAAASLSFNVAASVQRGRLEQVRNRKGHVTPSTDEDGDWEVEIVSAVLEALQNEAQSEDIGASIAVVSEGYAISSLVPRSTPSDGIARVPFAVFAGV